MTSHTPYPWRIESHRSSRIHDRVTSYVIYSDSDVDAEGREISPEDPIGEIYGGWDEKEMHANALQAIAAPTLEAENKVLREALEQVEPYIGWRSALGKNPDLYYCEFCKESHDESSLIEHHDDCLVTTIRAVLSEEPSQ